ncbi:uncharacterized protein LOC117320398 [Pecten maximus]|uniref:uncharacterized protein LOC117320398 n=1 Tax=Pecten maximus TaxID=6579 RepID=UPI0014588153|nr:uncharacterized protein LOC117320398 [Pecten maximus]
MAYGGRWTEVMSKHLKTVEDATRKGDTLDPRDVMSHLYRTNISDRRMKEAVMGQVKIAIKKGRRGWLRRMAEEARSAGLFTDEWIEGNIFKLQGRHHRRDNRRESIAEQAVFEPVRDYRLQQDPTLPKYVEEVSAQDGPTRLDQRSYRDALMDCPREEKRSSPEKYSSDVSNHSGGEYQEELAGESSREDLYVDNQSTTGEGQDSQLRGGSSEGKDSRFSGNTDTQRVVVLMPAERDMPDQGKSQRGSPRYQRQSSSRLRGSDSSRGRSMARFSQKRRPSPRSYQRNKGTYSTREARSPTPRIQSTRGAGPKVHSVRVRTDHQQSSGVGQVPVRTREIWNSSYSRKKESSKPEEQPTPTRHRKRKAKLQGQEGQPPEKKSHRGHRKGEICKIGGCGKETWYPKRHLVEAHLPNVLEERHPLTVDLHRTRYSCLAMFAVCTVGPTAGLQDLCDWINRYRFIEPGWKITDRQRELMVGLCEEQGWEVPQDFSLSPINSPAALLHWRCLKAIANQIARGTMNELRERFTFTSEQVLVEPEAEVQDTAGVDVKDPIEAMETSSGLRVSTGRSAEDPGLEHQNPAGDSLEDISVPESKRMEESKPVMSAFDSHFHLDRIRRYLKLHHDASVHDVLAAVPTTPGEYQLEVSGGVAVYCDPETYPSVDEISRLVEEGFKAVIGVHPKHCISKVDKQRLVDLLVVPGVAGLGEVGLDHTCRPDTWYPQEQLLKDLLSYLCPGMVLVLHIRGMKRDAAGVEAFMRCLDILQLQGVSSRQKIQLHCFSGTARVVESWLEVYPNTYFSVSGLVFHFNDAQRKAIKSIPLDRLLLETDAPYFPVSAESSCSAPHLIDITARKVAEIRGGITVREVLGATEENARTFFC